MKIRKIHIEEYKVFKDFEIDFTYKDKPLDVIVLAGINGNGKSTLLEFIYNFINDGSFRDNHSYIKYKEEDLKQGFKDEKILIGVPDPDILIEFDYPTHISDQLNDSAIFFKTYHTDTKFAEEIIVRFIDKLIYEENKTSKESYLETSKILINNFKDFKLDLDFDSLDRYKTVYFRNKTGKKLLISDLSSGEKELIVKIFSLKLSNIKQKIILIDELESSLHPNWQNRILKIYEDFAKENNNQVIVATHSPHVIASAPEGSLRLLKKEGDRIKVVSELDGAYGYEVQRVLLEVMDVDSLRNPEINKKLEDLKSMVFNNKYESEKYKELKRELEDTLGRNDIDLSLLRLEVAKREKMNEKNQ